MKKSTIWMLAAGMLLFTACGGKNDKKSSSKEDSPGLMDAVHAVSNLKKMGDQAEKSSDRQEDLSKMEPVSNDVLKAVFPETLLGMKRTKYSVSSNSMFGNMATGDATYEGKNKGHIKLSIVDGAGEMGSAAYALVKITLSADMEKQTEHGFSKTTEIEGHKILFEQDSSSYDQSVTTKISTALYHRFIVKLSGENISAEQLKKAYKALDFSPLEKASEKE